MKTTIDTSSWIEFLRSSRTEPSQRVAALIRNDEAAWCDLIPLEPWNGVQPGPECKVLEELESATTRYDLSREVWQKARQLAIESWQSGLAAPVTALVITACALHHDLLLEHRDQHIAQLLRIAEAS